MTTKTPLRSLKSVPSAEVELKDETGAPTGVFFMLAGPIHEKRKQITMVQARKAQARFRKSGKIELDDPEEQQIEAREQLAAFTLGWRVDEKSTFSFEPYSPQAAAALYADDEMAWVFDQVRAAVNETERFMKRSATT
jgi:hypothetical protein